MHPDALEQFTKFGKAKCTDRSKQPKRVLEVSFAPQPFLPKQVRSVTRMGNSSIESCEPVAHASRLRADEDVA